MPGRAGLPGQSPHAPWAAVDKGLGRPARDALAVSDFDACQEGLGLAVAAIDVDLEQVLEDPTVRARLSAMVSLSLSAPYLKMMTLEPLKVTSSYFFAHAYTWECTFCTAFFSSP